MKYIKIKFQNYKGIKELILDLSEGGPVFTLVGLNESGKSTILEAINSLFEVPEKDVRPALIPKNKKFSFRGNIVMAAKVRFDNNEIDELKKYLKSKGLICENINTELTISRSAKFMDSKEVSFNNTWLFVPKVKTLKGRTYKSLYEANSSVWHETITFIREYLMPKILYYPNFLFEFPDRIYLNGTKKMEEENIKYYDVVQDILSYVDSGLTIEKHILARLDSDSDQEIEIANALIEQMSSITSTVILDQWWKLFPKSNKSIVLEIKNETINGELIYYAGFHIKEGVKRYFLSDRSLGFRWFFSFLLFTEFRKMRSSDRSKVIFLLDEPASNLHPSAQTSLLKSFERLTEKSILIYTTHSHHLINPDWLESTFIVKNLGSPINPGDPPLTTEITIEKYKTFVGSHSDQREYFQPILDALDYKPGLLEKIPSIVIVEGKNDYYTLRAIYKHLQPLYEFSFYPGGGAGSNDMVIRLYESWGRNYLVLHDSDREGEDTISNYINEIPGLNENRMVTFKDVNNVLIGKSLEYLFSATDRLKISQISNPKVSKFSKKYFNISFQYQLINNDFLFEEETINNFKDLFEELNSRLNTIVLI